MSRDDLVVVNEVLGKVRCSLNDEVVRRFTAVFEGGVEVDVKVVDADPPYVDAVLFEDGSEVVCLDVRVMSSNGSICGRNRSRH